MKHWVYTLNSDWKETPKSAFSNRNLLLIDATDREHRKARATYLLKLGFHVFPGTRIEDAHRRCTPGKFDLVIVNAGVIAKEALAFCDQLQASDPGQHLIMLATPDTPRREYAIPDSAAGVRARAQEMFRSRRLAKGKAA